MLKNKRAWIRIVEAFVAIMLIVGALLIVINNDSFNKSETSSDIYGTELLVLREIELNDNLRADILNANRTKIDPNSDPLPIEWKEFNNPAIGLKNVSETILNRIPSYLNCEAKLCEPDKICAFGKNLEKNVYAKSIIISATLTQYNPRQLKLFCWIA